MVCNRPAMLVDLHAHYPMHIVGRGRGSLWRQLRSRRGRRLLLFRIQAALVHFAGRFGNYRTFSSGPRIKMEYMQEGGVGVALSVLYSFFAEVDVIGGVEPDTDYLATIEDQLRRVREDIEGNHSDEAAIATNPAQLETALADGKIAIVHCLEGGYHLGPTRDDVTAAVETLADQGIAYITLAHLIWRGVATGAPALPWWTDAQYHRWLPQPDEGLSDLGKAAVEAMVRRRVLIDLSHMSELSLADTFALLDSLDPDGEVPVVVTHAGYRFGEQEYMLDRSLVEAVARRNGVIGLIMARHQIEDRIPPRPKRRLPQSPRRRFNGSFEILCEHIEEIRRITGSYRHVAIGSDFDGFIKPTLPGLEDMRDMAQLQRALVERFGKKDAEAICSGNALGLLTGYWQGAPED